MTPPPRALAIDLSASMLFGAAGEHDPAGSKLQFAQYLATGFRIVR